MLPNIIWWLLKEDKWLLQGKLSLAFISYLGSVPKLPKEEKWLHINKPVHL